MTNEVVIGVGAARAYGSIPPRGKNWAVNFAQDAWQNTTDFVGDVGENLGKAWDGLWSW